MKYSSTYTTRTITTTYNTNAVASAKSYAYKFRPKVVNTATASTPGTPFRFFYNIASSITLDGTEAIKVSLDKATGGGTVFAPSGGNPTCLVRLYTSKGKMTESYAPCTKTGTEYTIGQPSLFKYGNTAGTYYEVIITTDSLSNYGIPNPNNDLYYKVTIQKDSASHAYREGQWFQYESS